MKNYEEFEMYPEDDQLYPDDEQLIDEISNYTVHEQNTYVDDAPVNNERLGLENPKEEKKKNNVVSLEKSKDDMGVDVESGKFKFQDMQHISIAKDKKGGTTTWINVHRDADGEIAEIESNINAGSPISRYDILAEVFAEYVDIALFRRHLYVRPKGIPYWVRGEDTIYSEFRAIFGSVSGRVLNDIMKELRAISKKREVIGSPLNTNLRSEHHINGNGEIVEGWTTEFTPWYLDVNYDPDAYSEHVETLFSNISGDDEGMLQLFKEIPGHAILRRKKDGKAFFLADTKMQGHTMKSTFGDTIIAFINPSSGRKEGYSSNTMGGTKSISRLSDDTEVMEIGNYMVNFGDETKMDYLEDTESFKSIVTQAKMNKRVAYGREGVDTYHTATLIFATNGMPDIADKSGGIARRLCIIPFERKIETIVDDVDESYVDTHMTTDVAKSHMLNYALEGVASMRANNWKVNLPDKVRDMNDLFLENNDPVASYLTSVENGEQSIEVTGTDHRIVYNNFADWLKTEGRARRTKKTFDASMAMYGYDKEQATVPTIMLSGTFGRPQVYAYKGDKGPQVELVEEFMESYDFENVYWKDVYNDYVDMSEQRDVTSYERKVFDKYVLSKGYTKDKASKKIFYDSGRKEGRPQVYTLEKINKNHPFM